MTQEEKAKAYDEALKRAKIWQGHLNECGDKDYADELDYIFPELQESEDEKVRKWLLDFVQGLPDEGLDFNFYNLSKKQVVAWLEKQGEQNLANSAKTCKDEQKPFDYENANIQQKDFALKVEPKFKVGDWIINRTDATIMQIVNNKDFYESVEIGGQRRTDTYNYLEWDFRLWTIQDAKDGDVLFQDLMCGKTFIYNGVNPDMAILYSFIISNDGKDVLPYHIGKPNTGIGNIEENKNIIHPATKKQCDLLFQKMHEAGYEWDAEKKELKKIVYDEDEEKIREKLIDTFNFYDPVMNSPFLLGINRKDIITWLEKQDKKLPVGFYYVNSEGKKFYSDTFKYGDGLFILKSKASRNLFE